MTINTPVDRFSTARLVAERVRATDLTDLCRMDQDPAVMEMIGGPRTETATREYLRKNIEHWDRHGFGLWILRNADGTFVGRSALRHLDVDGNDEIEIAYALMPQHWGFGLATEVSRAVLDIAFLRQNLADVVGLVQPGNRASCNVLQKLGGEVEREVMHAGLPHALYRLVRRVGAA